MSRPSLFHPMILLAAVCLAGMTLCLSGCEKAASGDDANVLRFTVEGMHCDGCASTVRSEVSKLDGVRSCRVSFEEGTAVVEVHDPAIAKSIIERLASLEYTATLREEGATVPAAPADETAHDHAADDSDEPAAPGDAGERE